MIFNLLHKFCILNLFIHILGLTQHDSSTEIEKRLGGRETETRLRGDRTVESLGTRYQRVTNRLVTGNSV